MIDSQTLEVINILLDVEELLTDAVWVQGVLALNAEGYPTDERDHTVQVCALGGLRYCVDTRHETDKEHNWGVITADAVNAVLQQAYDLSRETIPADETLLTEWNDDSERTAADVRALFRQAALAKARGE